MEKTKKEEKVQLKVVKNEEEKETKKLSYDEINNIAQKLYEQNRELQIENLKLKEVIQTINRLDYLMKVLSLYYGNKNNLVTFDNDFISECIEEIQKNLIIPKEEEKKEE